VPWLKQARLWTGQPVPVFPADLEYLADPANRLRLPYLSRPADQLPLLRPAAPVVLSVPALSRQRLVVLPGRLRLLRLSHRALRLAPADPAPYWQRPEILSALSVLLGRLCPAVPAQCWQDLADLSRPAVPAPYWLDPAAPAVLADPAAQRCRLPVLL
jgi:hypothetical protein